MHAYVRRGLYIALLSGGGILLAAGQASAGESTTGQESLLGGNQVTVPVTAPVTVGGTAVAVGGDAASASGGRAPAVVVGRGVRSGSTTDEGRGRREPRSRR